MGYNHHRRNPDVKARNRAIWRCYLQALCLCYVPRKDLETHVAKSLGLKPSTVAEVIQTHNDLVGCYDG